MAKKEKSILKKVRQIKRNTSVAAIIAFIIVSTLLVTMIAGIIAAAGGGFLLLFRPESLKTSSTQLRDNPLRNGVVSNPMYGGIPDLLPGSRFYVPVEKNTFSSMFGIRNANVKGSSRNHKGIDIGAGGQEVFAYPARPGIVKVAHSYPKSQQPRTLKDKGTGSGGSGQYVVIEHMVEGRKMTTKYLHFYRVYVTEGQVVNMDTKLGQVGNTGTSGGAHMHFEILDSNGNHVNPTLMLYCGNTKIKVGVKASDCFKYRGDAENEY